MPMRDIDRSLMQIPDQFANRMREIEQQTAGIGRRNEELRNAQLRMARIAQHGMASEVCEHLTSEINEFQKKLDDSLDVAVNLIAFGREMILRVDSLGYQNPHLVYFYGSLLDDTSSQLIQHVQQLSFLLTSVKRSNPERPRKRIGFHVPAAASESGEST